MTSQSLPAAELVEGVSAALTEAAGHGARRLRGSVRAWPAVRVTDIVGGGPALFEGGVGLLRGLPDLAGGLLAGGCVHGALALAAQR